MVAHPSTYASPLDNTSDPMAIPNAFRNAMVREKLSFSNEKQKDTKRALEGVIAVARKPRALSYFSLILFLSFSFT